MPTTIPSRWNPFRQLSRFEQLPEFEDFFRGFGLRPLSRITESTMDMRMDINEDDKFYYVTVDIPGVKKEDIDVSVEGNQITINAEVSREKTRESEREVYSERYAGKAYRSFSLPAEVDSAKSQARYESGVLTLTLPKKASAESKHLSIN